MAFVSCMLAPTTTELDLEVKEEGYRRIMCTDDQGTTWFLTEDSQVGDWLRYVESGGEVTPYVEPETPEEEPDV